MRNRNRFSSAFAEDHGTFWPADGCESSASADFSPAEFEDTTSREVGRGASFSQRLAAMSAAILVIAGLAMIVAYPNSARADSRVNLPVTPPNTPPVITTKSLPQGRLYRWYQATVAGVDVDGDWLHLTTSGLPAGVTQQECTQVRTEQKSTISCPLTGRPLQRGIFPVTVFLTDDRGGSDKKILPLNIK